jgi:hypothetical protein
VLLRAKTESLRQKLLAVCEKCQHSAPLACAVAVIRGATIQHPGWGGNDVGFLPFPVEKLAAQ